MADVLTLGPLALKCDTWTCKKLAACTLTLKTDKAEFRIGHFCKGCGAQREADAQRKLDEEKPKRVKKEKKA